MAAEPQQNRQPAPTRLSESDVGRWLDEHGDVLFCFARDRVRRREDAEDIVQEAFLAAIQAVASYEGRASERTWLLSILRRKIVDFYRRRRDPFCDVCGGPGALDSFWVKLRCGVLTTLSGPRHPSQVSRGRRAASAFSLLLCSPATVGP